MTPASALDLARTFAVLQPDQSVELVPVTADVYEELDRRFDGFKGRTLVSVFAFDADWPTWERHPAGDELVCLLSGEATFLLEDGRSIHLREPGTYVVVPRGVWHTAHTRVPTRMLFITPGESTQNRPV